MTVVLGARADSQGLGFGFATRQQTIRNPTDSDVTVPAGATLTKQPDGSVLAGGPVPQKDIYTVSCQTETKGVRALRLEVLTDPSLPGDDDKCICVHLPHHDGLDPRHGRGVRPPDQQESREKADEAVGERNPGEDGRPQSHGF